MASYTSRRRSYTKIYSLIVWLALLLQLLPFVGATRTTTVNRLVVDDTQRKEDAPIQENAIQHNNKHLAMLECREDMRSRTDKYPPICSFRLGQQGQDTYQVCTTTTTSSDGPATKSCWQVTLNIQPVAVVETNEDSSTTTSKDSSVKNDPKEEKSFVTNENQSSKGDPPGRNAHDAAPPLDTTTKSSRPDPPETDNEQTIKSKQVPPEMVSQTKQQQKESSPPKPDPDSQTISQRKRQPQSIYDKPIQIGIFTYNPPFDNFGRDIQYLLQRPRYDDMTEEARWLQSIGVAFQQRAQRQFGLGVIGGHTIQDSVQRATAAFEEALLRYKDATAHLSTPSSTSPTGLSKLDLQLKMAMVYMELATTHQLSLDQPTQVVTEYFTRAEAALKELYDQTVATTQGTAQFGVELVTAYAEVCLRLGVAFSQGSDWNNVGGTDVAMGGVAGQAEEWLLLQAGDNYESLLQNPEKVEKMLREHVPPLVAKTHGVIRLFVRSKTLWWNMLLGESNVRSRLSAVDARQALQHLATTTQNLGNSWLALEQYEPAVTALEESWQIQEEMILPQMTPMSLRTERDAMLVAMGENLYSLADVYLRMGNYDKAMDRYKRAMDWFHKYSIAPPPTPTPEDAEENDDHKAMIQTYEEALEEYHAMFKDGVDSSDPVLSDRNGFYSRGEADFGDQAYYQRNDGYEGDLHNTLGAFYLNAGDYDQATMHLQQALRLYLKAGEGQDATTASTHTQLAALYFQQGKYLASAEQHGLALEIFKRISTPGENPLLQGGTPIVQWPELLAEALRNLPDVEADLPPSLDINSLVEVDGQVEEKPKVAIKKIEPIDPPARQTVQETPKETIAPKIQIDLDAFSRAQVNETNTALDEL